MADERGMTTDTGVLYIPFDYNLPLGVCENCGNPAPERPFLRVDALCQPCYVSIVTQAVVTQSELAYLIERLGKEALRRMEDPDESAW